ncbi:MAG: hypothetical protein AAB886_00390 [Patescibacteria group bacterium]
MTILAKISEIAVVKLHKLASVLPVAIMLITIITSGIAPVSKVANAQVIFGSIPSLSFQINNTAGFPESDYREATRRIKISVTAYNSLPEQTDDTPFETADGTMVRDGIVAANFLKLGTRVRFPELYGDKIFVVKDRMNARYDKRADIWMKHKSDALALGHKYTTIEIF